MKKKSISEHLKQKTLPHATQGVVKSPVEPVMDSRFDGSQHRVRPNNRVVGASHIAMVTRCRHHQRQGFGHRTQTRRSHKSEFPS